MNYKASDIKPKRYPDEKPSNDYVLAYPDLHGEWFYYFYEDRGNMYPWDTRPIQWFIDIPGAPPELKPLAYPENKPEQDGKYWCHVGTDHVHAIEHDSWEVMRWEWDEYNKKNNWNGYRILIDYFIPYRLDKENEMDIKVFMDWDNKTGEVNITKPVTLEKGDFMVVIRKYLDAFGYDIIERLDCVRIPEKDDEMDVIWETDELMAEKAPDGTRVILWHPKVEHDRIGVFYDELTAFARHWLDLQGYDVTRKEPEIKACPNPTCEQTKYLEVIEVPSRYSHPNKAFIVECKNCGYRGGRGSSIEQAIKLHNLICEKTVVTNVANISALPRRNGEE